MKKVSGNQHLLRRNSVYYYRRQVPQHLVKKIGKQFIQNSLNTTSLAEAKKLRALRDLQWDARFDALKDAAPERESAKSQTTVNSTELSEGKLLRLVREYVEHKDKEFVRVLPAILRKMNVKAEMRMEAGSTPRHFETAMIPKPTSGFTYGQGNPQRAGSPSTTGSPRSLRGMDSSRPAGARQSHSGSSCR
jgi:hypothetical protein